MNQQQSQSAARCTPVSEWPDLDRAAWAVALEPADPFEPSSGYAHRWKASTRKEIEGGYGRWLHWLAQTGQLDRASAPGQRVTHERTHAYLRTLRDAGNADNTIAGRLQQLCNALRAMDPLGDWQWIHRASSRIQSNAVPVRDPVSRMQPAEDIIALGVDLMRAAEHDRFRSPCDRATLFRDGLILAFLVQRPFRSVNLASIRLGEHLQQVGGTWRLRIDASETKGGEAIQCDWPAVLVEGLEQYLKVHREELLKGASPPNSSVPSLWISRHGKPMGVDAISVQVGNRTRGEFGRAINLHTFRHIAATTIATSDPAGSANIQCVLGHASMTASEKYYNRATRLSAGVSFQGTIADLRRRRRG